MTQHIGDVVWRDLTVENAEAIKDFYATVVGWKPSPVSMGDYDDFSMQTPAGDDVAGVCHARGGNANLPAQWLLYFLVADLEASLHHTKANGGQQLTDVKHYGEQGRYAIIQDPAGAVCALYQDLTLTA